MPQKGIYPFEYMDNWKAFYEILLPERNFCSRSNTEDITHADYTHAKIACKSLKIKDIGENHDLYVQSDTL